MGILNPKTRIIDVVMTPYGREMLAQGGIDVSYASLTDGQAYYDPSSITGSYDTATDRISFEAPPSLPHDTFSLVTDDTGKLVPASAFGTDIDSDGTLYFRGGTLVTSSDHVETTLVGGLGAVKGYTSGSNFSSSISTLVDLFKNALACNTIIASRDPLDDSPNFVVSPTAGKFYIDNSMTKTLPVTSINTADSLFFDKRFANLPQFRFLPPIVSTGKSQKNLGSYTNIKKFNNLSYQDLKRSVFGTNRNPIKQRLDITVEDTSLTNDMVVQFFEITPDGMTKLDAVDYGEAYDPEDRERPKKRIVFFGKVFLDETESATFVNLFTVVFD